MWEDNLLSLAAGDVILSDVSSCGAVVSSYVAVVVGSFVDDASLEVASLTPYVDPPVVVIEPIDDDGDKSDGVNVVVVNSYDDIRIGADDITVDNAVVC